MATIQGVYVALFGRPADPTGLAYFKGVTQDGADLSAIGDLAGTAEYKARFEGQSNVQIVNSIYRSLFNRDADVAGLNFFVDALNKGTLNINNIAIAILDGAQGDDKTVVETKVAAADAFTAALDTTAEIIAYDGAAAAAQGRAFLASVSTTAPTQAAIDAAIAAVVAGPGSGTGEVYTLTPSTNVVTGGVDIFTGTAGGDNFRAIAANSLDSTDILDGGAGQDELNISANGISTAAGGNAPTLRNIERINNAETVIALNLSAATGVQQVWTTGTAGSYLNANLATVFGAQATGAGNTAVTVDFAGSLAGTTTAQLAVSNGTGTATFTFDAGDVGAIEAVSINAVASSGGSVVIDPALTVLDTITVTGAGRLTVTSAETTIKTFDASANTGGVTFNTGALAAAATLTGGAGNDVINATNVAATTVVLTIDAGAGNDVITGGAGNDSINAGEGNDIVNGSTGADTITLGAGNDVMVYTAVNQSQFAAGATNNTRDVITDFNAAGDDTFQISAAVGNALNTALNLTNIQTAVNNLAGTATLADALAAASANLGVAGTVSYFQFQGNTFVVANSATPGFAAADDFVLELTGNVSLSAADFQFVA